MQYQSRERQKKSCKTSHVVPLWVPSYIFPCTCSKVLRGQWRNWFYRWMTQFFTSLNLRGRGPVTCINPGKLKKSKITGLLLSLAPARHGGSLSSRYTTSLHTYLPTRSFSSAILTIDSNLEFQCRRLRVCIMQPGCLGLTLALMLTSCVNLSKLLNSLYLSFVFTLRDKNSIYHMGYLKSKHMKICKELEQGLEDSENWFLLCCCSYNRMCPNSIILVGSFPSGISTFNSLHLLIFC